MEGGLIETKRDKARQHRLRDAWKRFAASERMHAKGSPSKKKDAPAKALGGSAVRTLEMEG